MATAPRRSTTSEVTTLPPLEARRLHFARYLVQSGRLSEHGCADNGLPRSWRSLCCLLEDVLRHGLDDDWRVVAAWQLRSGSYA